MCDINLVWHATLTIHPSCAFVTDAGSGGSSSGAIVPMYLSNPVECQGCCRPDSQSYSQDIVQQWSYFFLPPPYSGLLGLSWLERLSRSALSPVPLYDVDPPW